MYATHILAHIHTHAHEHTLPRAGCRSLQSPHKSLSHLLVTALSSFRAGASVPSGHGRRAPRRRCWSPEGQPHPGEVADMWVTADSKQHLAGGPENTTAHSDLPVSVWGQGGGAGAGPWEVSLAINGMMATVIDKFKDRPQTTRSSGRGWHRFPLTAWAGANHAHSWALAFQPPEPGENTLSSLEPPGPGLCDSTARRYSVTCPRRLTNGNEMLSVFTGAGRAGAPSGARWGLSSGDKLVFHSRSRKFHSSLQWTGPGSLCPSRFPLRLEAPQSQIYSSQ